jgi:hypothetical protein
MKTYLTWALLMRLPLLQSTAAEICEAFEAPTLTMLNDAIDIL